MKKKQTTTGGNIEYDYLMHIRKGCAGLTDADFQAQNQERFSVKRYAECPNCFVIMPASDELIKLNSLKTLT